MLLFFWYSNNLDCSYPVLCPNDQLFSLLPVKLFHLYLAHRHSRSQRKQKTGTDYAFTGRGRALMVEGAAVGSPLVPRWPVRWSPDPGTCHRGGGGHQWSLYTVQKRWSGGSVGSPSSSVTRGGWCCSGCHGRFGVGVQGCLQPCGCDCATSPESWSGWELASQSPGCLHVLRGHVERDAPCSEHHWGGQGGAEMGGQIFSYACWDTEEWW